MHPYLSCKYESLSTTVLIKYDFNIPSDELCQDIYDKAGVLLCNGDCFEMPYTFRLGYGFGQPEILKEGLKLLGDYFTELSKKNV